MLPRRLWFWLAASASAGNALAAVYVATMMNGSAMHVFGHVVIAGLFGLGAKKIASGPRRGREVEAQHDEQVLMLQENLSDLERELHETRQRLEFADQLLKNKKEEPKE